MSSHFFDLQKLSEKVDEFVNTVPEILKANPLTADLSSPIELLREELNTPFSLAIVGQMRIGKSSLMNGLIGKKTAIVGVNETTATINFFKYKEGVTDKFRVHWKDRPPEYLPLECLEDWIGDSTCASQSNYLEFFSNNSFFKTINLVDTPGTRSVLEDHEEVINDFLAEKREKETLQHGGKADAIIYVSSAVANTSAEELLQDFQNNTRLPGSSPFNSVAVIHKWETLNVNAPSENAHKKAAFMEKQLKGYVSRVIPVSGPLALVAKSLDDEFWDTLVSFIKNSEKDNLLKQIERGDRRFFKHFPQGKELQAQAELPWPCFKIIIKTACSPNVESGILLRDEILKLSGINELMDFIENRFIERRNLIKSLTTLNKAFEPCQIAQLRISADVKTKKKLLEQAEQSISILNNYTSQENKFLEHVSKFIETAKVPFSKELNQNIITQKNLSLKSSSVEGYYKQINGDLKALSLLDKYHDRFSGTANEIDHICGKYGFSTSERLACYPACSDELISFVEKRLEYWEEKEAELPGDIRFLAKHMYNRLEEILDDYEQDQVP